jgi:hypothetical protein
VKHIIRRLTFLIVFTAVLAACLNPTPTPPPPPQLDPTLAARTTPDASRDTFGLIRAPMTPADISDAQLVNTTDIPVGDYRTLAIKFQGLPSNTPATTCTTAPTYTVGDQMAFMAFSSDTLKQFTVTATLIARTDHADMWLDNKWLTLVDQDALKQAAQRFSDTIYERDRALFGDESNPGIDCDPHIHILNTSGTASGGYFWSVDQFTKAVRSDSNEKDMFYIDIEGSGGPDRIGGNYYDGVLAHEFQHLILYNHDRNEDTWVSEGMSDLAIFLNGDDPTHDRIAAAQSPDVQLNTWPETGVADAVNYGTAFSFMLYFWDRFGDAGVRALAAEPANGLSGVQKVLDKLEPGKRVDDFVADWLVARFLDDPSIEDGRYGYAKTDRAKVQSEKTIRQYPFSERASVHQYAGDYVTLRDDHDLTIDFTGSTKAPMINAPPHSGQYFWWSNRGDVTDLTLQHAFDLTSVKTATLKYWTWYSLEKDWDYGYLTVSDDGGQTWHIIQTPSSTNSNPVNSNYGWGETGNSGGGDQPQWIQETVDLSAYVGKTIIVGFEVINDLAVNLPGMAIDDVELPEINYQDDFENGDGGWQAAGWIRTDNFVPQGYIVQLIGFDKDGRTTVTRLPLKDDNTATWDVPLSQLDHAVIVFSAMAPKTTEVAGFNWSAREK